ncbi:MAG: hypothetical protein HF977_15235 [ANME-2 cluster archaeon]|nr:hypothetical protein [ANME-2 cluster archaeon]MBC2764058.1 hypothetical protein [ANME-2 cluster archaeon]
MEQSETPCMKSFFTIKSLNSITNSMITMATTGSTLHYSRLYPILSEWTPARIHKAGCHTAALAGCGGRVKCRCRNGGRVWKCENGVGAGQHFTVNRGGR